MMSKNSRSSPIEKGDPWRQNILPPIRGHTPPPKNGEKFNHEDILVYGSMSEIDIYSSDMLMDDNGDSKFFDCDVCAKGYHRAVSPSYSKSATDQTDCQGKRDVKKSSNVDDAKSTASDDDYVTTPQLDDEAQLDDDSQLEDERRLNNKRSDVTDYDYSSSTPQPDYDTGARIDAVSSLPNDPRLERPIATILLQPPSTGGIPLSRPQSHALSAPPSKANYNFDVEGLLVQLDRVLNRREFDTPKRAEEFRKDHAHERMMQMATIKHEFNMKLLKEEHQRKMTLMATKQQIADVKLDLLLAQRDRDAAANGYRRNISPMGKSEGKSELSNYSTYMDDVFN